jgi:AraC family transcriptional regulator
MLDPAAARTTAEASSLTARRRRALVAYVDDNLAGEVTLAGMADAVGLSPWHFVRVFKAATGQTPYAWVVSRRVDRVKQALQQGHGTLSEVATACGFASQSHMTEVFRRTVGVTPGRWRSGVQARQRLPRPGDDT